MNTKPIVPPSPRTSLPQRPLHLRSLSNPLSRSEAQRLFARQQAAEAFGRVCA